MGNYTPNPFMTQPAHLPPLGRDLDHSLYQPLFLFTNPPNQTSQHLFLFANLAHSLSQPLNPNHSPVTHSCSSLLVPPPLSSLLVP